MPRYGKIRAQRVICRIGSLESKRCADVHLVIVICRIGSLETTRIMLIPLLVVICRIGSLENKMSHGEQ